MSETQPIQPDSQLKRRIKFGLNVGVATAAAAGIVVLINIIVDQTYRAIPLDQRDLVRYDLTSTRQYSLAPQTLRVLEQLDGDFEVVSMFRTTDRYTQDVRDLIDDYALHSGSIEVTHIDPARDVAAAERFYAQVLERYDDEIAPLREAIDTGRLALTTVSQQMTAASADITAAVAASGLPEGEQRGSVEAVAGQIAQHVAAVDRVDRILDQMMEQPLPEFTSIVAQLQQALATLHQSNLNAAARRTEMLGNDESLPNGLRDALLGAVKQLEQAQQTIADALKAMAFAVPAAEYDEVLNKLMTASGGLIAVVGPQRLRVIPLTEMYRQVSAEQTEQIGQPELAFLGEEQLTGALLSMSLDTPPLVVFIQPTRQPALGPNGGYEYVARRLRAANFEVQEWSPLPTAATFGQGMTPPPDPPQAKPGQQTIWIVSAFGSANPNDPMSMMTLGNAKTQVAALVTERLAHGDGVMFMLAMRDDITYGAEDPLLDLLASWGIMPQLDHLLLREQAQANQQARTSIEFFIERWPADSVITRSLAGMLARFIYVSPIDIEPADGTVYENLVVINEPKTWSQAVIDIPRDGPPPRYDEAYGAQSFVAALSAARDDARMIVVACPYWASDSETAMGLLGANTADLVGAALPGNSELFINGVYWLAGIEELIAPSPRSQDVRRVGDISPAAVSTLHWTLIAGLPVVVFLVGITVSLVRRKG